jgi:lipopolysaccharide biosynthesis glycosyltransferase
LGKQSKVVKLDIYVGYDGKVEPIAYHNFCQSVIEKSSIPVSFTPLALNTLKDYEETHKDGSNAFIYSRFLVPYLNNFKGIALFVDGDMICRTDIAEILANFDTDEAIKVVKHHYQTKHPVKYLGAKNEDYPKKNWSSVMLWNCSHWLNKQLTPKFVQEQTGKYLHRFEWLKYPEEQVGKLDETWNWLETEYEYNEDAKLVHHTLGTPCFKDYQHTDYSQEWWDCYKRMIYPLTGNNKESKL